MELTEVSKHYEGPNGAAPLCILQDVSLSIAPGESVAIVGPSGSGKSTLLHLMGTLDRPSSGRVSLNGVDLAGLDDLQLAAVRSRNLGFVFQAHYLLPQCTVYENVLVPTLAGGPRHSGLAREPHGGEAPDARALRLLKRVGLGERLGHRPGQLSGGERQRVAVVRALINGPQLLLADEPTGSLDEASAEELGRLLIELNREEKVAVVVVTHARALARRMSRVLRLKGGKLEATAAGSDPEPESGRQP